MPITSFLDGHSFDSETRRVMGVAFELARLALGVEDRENPANKEIARRIIELAKWGERGASQFVALDSRASGCDPHDSQRPASTTSWSITIYRGTRPFCYAAVNASQPARSSKVLLD